MHWRKLHGSVGNLRLIIKRKGRLTVDRAVKIERLIHYPRFGKKVFRGRLNQFIKPQHRHVVEGHAGIKKLVALGYPRMLFEK
jgi:hypothetical protein